MKENLFDDIGLLPYDDSEMGNYVFKRKIYDELLEWKKHDAGSKALLIEGARRIGKTTLVKEFAKREYGSHIYIDLSKADEELLSAFDDLTDMDAFYRRLFLLSKGSLKERDGLLILDEVQFSPRARMSVKAICEDGRYDVIETGSLLSIRHGKKKKEKPYMIPSEERRLEMHPLDFEEFCLALGESPSSFSILKDIKEGKLPLSTISEGVHRKWMGKLRQYLAIGGMPKVIDKFVKTNSYYEAHKEKEDIIKLYRDDLSKLDSNEGTLMRETFDLIPNRMALEGSSRFIISDLFGEGRGDLLPKTLANLSDSKIANILYCCKDPRPGLALSKDPKKFKVYCADSGIFVSLFLDSMKKSEVLDFYRKLAYGKLEANLGSLYEHFVLQSLVSQGDRPFYHSFEMEEEGKNKRYEIDFLLYRRGRIIPIEVKSGKSFSSSSLDAIKRKYSSSIGERYLLSPKMPKKEDGVNCLPVYFAGLL